MIRFVTFNIRCDYDQDGANSFRFRRDFVRRKIEREKPDVLCFQEVVPHVAVWLRETLREYSALGCGRSASFEDEQMTILFRPDRFELLAYETFWLSPSGVPGSRFPGQSGCPRTAAEAILYDRTEKTLFRVINTHLDHESADARAKGLAQILERIAHPRLFPEAHVILAGDFNAEPDWPELAPLWANGRMTDAARDAGGTFHDYGRETPPEKIDYVCLAPDLRGANASCWTDEENGLYLSDHYPVYVEITTAGA